MLVQIRPNPGVSIWEMCNYLLKHDIDIKMVSNEIIEVNLPTKIRKYIEEIAEVKPANANS
jgi:hypothetical protein